jgi:hypothetical protein
MFSSFDFPNMKLSKNSFLSCLTFVTAGLLSSSPVLAVNIHGFDGGYAPGNWTTYGYDGSTATEVTPVDATTLGVVSQNSTDLNIDLNCSAPNPLTCPVGATYINDGSYIEQHITIGPNMGGVINFQWSFAFGDELVNAGYTLNGNFHVLAIGTTGGGSTPSTNHEELTVNQGDVLAFIVQTFASGGSSPDSTTTYGAFNVHDFKVKDIPFEFNPLQGVALGLPLFLGLRILKKRRNHKLQSSK